MVERTANSLRMLEVIYDKMMMPGSSALGEMKIPSPTLRAGAALSGGHYFLNFFL